MQRSAYTDPHRQVHHRPVTPLLRQEHEQEKTSHASNISLSVYDFGLGAWGVDNWGPGGGG